MLWFFKAQINSPVEANCRRTRPPGQLVDRHVADHEGLVGLEPVGMVAGRHQDRPAIQQQRRLLRQVLRLADVHEQIARRPAVLRRQVIRRGRRPLFAVLAQRRLVERHDEHGQLDQLLIDNRTSVLRSARRWHCRTAATVPATTLPFRSEGRFASWSLNLGITISRLTTDSSDDGHRGHEHRRHHADPRDARRHEGRHFMVPLDPRHGEHGRHQHQQGTDAVEEEQRLIAVIARP